MSRRAPGGGNGSKLQRTQRIPNANHLGPARLAMKEGIAPALNSLIVHIRWRHDGAP